jgi:hypothetical protein
VRQIEELESASPVDAEWMLTTFAYGYGASRERATTVFYSAKIGLRNSVAAYNGDGGLFDQLLDPSYRNAPDAMV